jgi:hypothetical protein
VPCLCIRCRLDFALKLAQGPLGLTKINYNACNYNDGLPVTIRFANKVGDVLTMGSARDAEKQPLKIYV